MSADDTGAALHQPVTPGWGFRHETSSGQWLALLTKWTEYFSGAVLAVDVLMVFFSVVYRYLLHDPVDWAEEVARALMIVMVFFGAATVLARSQHVGVDLFRNMLPASWQPALIQMSHWIIAGVSASLFASSVLLLLDSYDQTTPLGLPQWLYVYPVVIGSLFLTLFGIANAANGPSRIVKGALMACVLAAAAVTAWNTWIPAHMVSSGQLLAAGFFGALFVGVPIGFVLAFSSLLYFLSDPSLPILVYSQQIMAGSDHFVLLAIPFFVLAGLLMESNGMSARLIELLLRIFGRVRGGLGLITITATAFFSGVSGSKLADVAAVGGIIMPAVRRTRQDPNEAAGLLACTAVMAETIPPCINMIIMGFVANISIAGLFMAGLVPAVVMALALATLAVIVGRKIDPDEAFESRTPMLKLLGGALVAIVRGDLDRGVRLRRHVCAGGWQPRLQGTERACTCPAFYSLGLHGRKHPVHCRCRLKFVLCVNDRADSATGFRQHDHLCQQLWQCDVPVAVRHHDDRFWRSARRGACIDHLWSIAHTDCAAAWHQSAALWYGHGDRNGSGIVCAADRPRVVCHVRHYRHRGQKCGASDDEIPCGTARDFDLASTRPLVFTMVAKPTWAVIQDIEHYGHHSGCRAARRGFCQHSI